MNAAGFQPAHSDRVVAEVLELFGEETDEQTVIGYLVDDEEAARGDWRGVGLNGDEGPRTVARWLTESTQWRDAIESGWRPTPPGS